MKRRKTLKMAFYYKTIHISKWLRPSDPSGIEIAFFEIYKSSSIAWKFTFNFTFMYDFVLE